MRVDYLAATSAGNTNFAWRLVTWTYVGGLLPLVTVVLPREEPIRWSFMAAWALTMVYLIASAAYDVKKVLDSAGTETSTPRRAMVNICVGLCAGGLANVALSGTQGAYRAVLLLDVLLAAAIGNRRFATIVWSFSIAVLAVSTVQQGWDISTMPAFVITYAIAWGAAAAMVHLLAEGSLRGINGVERLADLAELAASVDDEDEGLRRMLPAICGYLGSFDDPKKGPSTNDRAAAYVCSADDQVRRLIAAWPEGVEPVEVPDDERLGAGHGERVVVDAAWASITVPREDGKRVVVVIERSAPDLREAIPYRSALERIAIQVAVLVDRAQLIRRLEELTRTDSLTELPNRRALAERIEHERNAARRRGDDLAVAMIDIDHFKDYNDSFGHLDGDDLLRNLSTMMRQRLRTTDFVARYGGEEFCVVMPATDAEGAIAVFRELHDQVAHIETRRPMTFSAGIAMWDGNEEPNQLLGRADSALYEAKVGGRNQTRVAPTPSAATHPA